PGFASQVLPAWSLHVLPVSAWVSSGLKCIFFFSCFFVLVSPGCCAFWCFPCFMCKTASEFGECLCLPLLDYSGIHPISLSIRSTMRERFHIQGSICGDCCVVVCCNTCSWCQMARELKHQKKPLVITAQSVPPMMAPGLYPSVPH
uniref:Plac8 onzin related protein 2 n=1 Tax=Erpetoichthys calabaricus TaxID=27687 RepID=A0A8C4SGS2_ERPCA